MKSLSLSLMLTSLLLAQAPPSQPPAAGQASAAAKLLSLPPSTVVAVIDGRKITAIELQTVLRVQPAAQQEATMRNPRTFVEQYGLMRRLTAMAEKAGMDQKSPLREQIEYNRMIALAQAQLQSTEAQITITPEESKKFYDGNQDLYSSVRLKVIYIPFSANPPAPAEGQKKVMSEAEAKAAADKVSAQLQAGADFVKLVKEYSGDQTSASKDGDFGVFRRSDRIPDDVKAVVFALKTGQVSRPLRQPNGFYIFRAEEVGTEPFEKVQKEIIDQLRSTRMNSWVQETQKSLDIKIENEALGTAPAAVK